MSRLKNPVLMVIIGVLLSGLVVGCGGSDESNFATDDSDELRQALGMSRPGFPGIWGAPASAAPAPAAPAPVMPYAVRVVEVPGETVVVEKEVVREVPVEVLKEVVVERVVTSAVQSAMLTEAGSGSQHTQAQLVTQRRIIIREVDMGLVVDDIQSTIDRIADMAADAGGWVVDSGRSSLHGGNISIRVPADLLDSTIAELRRIAKKVDAELTTSRDVTDEYVDLGARLKNQQATEQALLALLERAESVEAALAVQRDLTNVQQEIERLSGRIKFLEETSAFSLIRVTLRLSAMEMAVDAGPDQAAAVNDPVRFRSTFYPPDGIEDFQITWDFGDGSNPVTIHRTAPTTEPGQLISATVAHSYGDPKDSPFIAQVNITGTGDGGLVEGKDTLTVSVSEVPAIEVYAGDAQRVSQGEEIEFSGSFTRPPGLTNTRFAWDFGDGSVPVPIAAAEGVTTARATHAYSNYRREPYTARLTVTADSSVGEVEASDYLPVFVKEELGFVVGGYELGENLKTAVRGLTAFVQGLSVVLIWLAIFSPIWAAIAAVVWLVVRTVKRRKATRVQETTEREPTAEQQASTAN